MFKGEKVKIRLKRFIPEQKVSVLIGEVLDMNDAWMKVKGKFYTLAKGEKKPRVDEQERTLGIPRDSIRLIRLLPKDVDLAKLKYTVRDNRLMVELDSRQPASISE
ncbi:MAG: hypothetical protein ABH836_05130 [Candidatus Omnitrophota bacterium]